MLKSTTKFTFFTTIAFLCIFFSTSAYAHKLWLNATDYYSRNGRFLHLEGVELFGKGLGLAPT